MTTWADAAERLPTAAAWYAALGWKILPIYGITPGGRCMCGKPHTEPKDVGKHPRISEWQHSASSDPYTVQRWWEEEPNTNVGVYCKPSGFFVLDVDPRHDGDKSLIEFEELVEGNFPKTVAAYTGVYSVNGTSARGRHYFFKCSEDELLVGNLKNQGLPGLDVKHNGYILLNPSRHFSGNCYEWMPGQAPWEMEMAEAPEELLSVLRRRSRKSTTYRAGDWGGAFDGVEWDGEKVDIEKMFAEGIDEGARAVEIYKMTCALANKMGVKDEIQRMAVETMMIRFNAEQVRPPLELEGPGGLLSHVRNAIQFVIDNPKTDRMWPGLSDFERSWAAGLSTPTPPTAPDPSSEYVPTYSDDVDDEDADTPSTHRIAGLTSLLDDGSISTATFRGTVNIPLDPDALEVEDGARIGMRTLTDTGNGRRLVDNFGDALRYTPGMGWFHWSGGYWKPDAEDLEVQELAKRLAPFIAAEVVNYPDPDDAQKVVSWANDSKSSGKIRATIDNANSDPRIVTSVDMWDASENLLGVANGVIDLKTGALLRGRPDLYITKRAPVAYTPGLRNARWEQFLDFATFGDKDFQEWIQRAAGYTLTGSRKYDLMFLVYGPAGSGKNTLVEALVKCLGTQQYAWPMDSTILAQNDGMSSSTDLYHWAELRGRRMVWVDELPESERLKENAVKKLTGSSEISARSPGEKPFTFASHAKLWITTNHRPIITDDAMWRRIRPVPLTRVPDTPDPDLKEYIFDPEGALPAVLAWAVEGAMKILNPTSKDALGWCDKVKDAAEIYRKSEDRIGLFLSEKTVVDETKFIPVSSLYMSYRMWSQDRGEREMTQIAFHRKLVDRNLNIDGHGSSAILYGYDLPSDWVSALASGASRYEV